MSNGKGMNADGIIKDRCDFDGCEGRDCCYSFEMVQDTAITAVKLAKVKSSPITQEEIEDWKTLLEDRSGMGGMVLTGPITDEEIAQWKAADKHLDEVDTELVKRVLNVKFEREEEPCPDYDHYCDESCYCKWAHPVTPDNKWKPAEEPFGDQPCRVIWGQQGQWVMYDQYDPYGFKIYTGRHKVDTETEIIKAERGFLDGKWTVATPNFIERFWNWLMGRLS